MKRVRWAELNRRTMIPLALAVALALVAAGGWWYAVHERPGDAPQRSAVMAAAARATTALMTRNPAEPPVRPEVAKQLTGRLADEYASLGADVVLPGAVERRMTMTARVVGTGTAELTGRRARVLLFVDLWAAPEGAGQQVPRVALSRWASMRKVDGDWLLAGLSPVTGALG